MKNLIKYFLIITILFVATQSVQTQKSQTKTRYYIFDDACFEKFHQHFKLAPTPCYSFMLSKITGYLLVLFSAIMRLPQIIAIFKQKSVAGVSFFSYTQQYMMTALAVGYSIDAKLPFSVYGQNVFLSIQNLIILFSFFIYGKKQQFLSNFFLLTICLGISGVFILQLVPRTWQQISVGAQIVFIVLARGAQILLNFKNKSTGNLSIIPHFMTISGCLIRVFNMMTEASDNIAFLMTFVAGIVLTGIILLQFLIYRNNKPKID